MSKPQQCLKATFDILLAKYNEGNSRELILQAVQDSTTAKFRRSGSSSAGLPSDTLLPGQTTNAQAMGAFADDVSVLSTLGGVVWTVSSVADALSSRMVRTSRRFWPQRLLHRR
jgi:hypothetical protein